MNPPRVKLADLQIVPATESQIDSFCACLDAVARERRFLALLHGLPPETVRAFVESNIAAGIPQFFAVTEGRVIGWCDVIPMEKPGFNHCGRLGMGVLHEFRGLGIGRLLAETTLARAEELGLERIELEVFASNEPAIVLYRKLGFELEGTKRKARKLDNAYDDVLLMARLFEPNPQRTTTLARGSKPDDAPLIL